MYDEEEEGTEDLPDAHYGQPPLTIVRADARTTSLTIDNIPVYMVGEVLELLKERFSDANHEHSAIEVNLTDNRSL